MVAYTQIQSSRGNEYWKLRDTTQLRRVVVNHELSVKGIRLGNKVYGPERARILDLAERGLVYYKLCSKEQLVVFCKQRGVGLPSLWPRKAEIIQALEKADEDRTFYGFAELPPELRVHIFELYFRSFTELEWPGIPPVAQASRLFRQEALPLFYKTCTFVIDVLDPERFRNALGGPHKRDEIFSVRFAEFLRHTPDRNLSWIRRIDMGGTVTRGKEGAGGPWAPHVHGRWLIDLSATDDKRLVGAYDAFMIQELVAWTSPYLQLAEDKLKQVVEAMVRNSVSGREGIRKLAEAFHRDDSTNA